MERIIRSLAAARSRHRHPRPHRSPQRLRSRDLTSGPLGLRERTGRQRSKSVTDCPPITARGDDRDEADDREGAGVDTIVMTIAATVVAKSLVSRSAARSAAAAPSPRPRPFRRASWPEETSREDTVRIARISGLVRHGSPKIPNQNPLVSSLTAFAPSASSSRTRRRASRADCVSRSARTVSRCRRAMPRCGTG
jgi:hypothetical protein